MCSISKELATKNFSLLLAERSFRETYPVLEKLMIMKKMVESGEIIIRSTK
jgi:hypothetical protein